MHPVEVIAAYINDQVRKVLHLLQKLADDALVSHDTPIKLLTARQPTWKVASIGRAR